MLRLLRSYFTILPLKPPTKELLGFGAVVEPPGRFYPSLIPKFRRKSIFSSDLGLRGLPWTPRRQPLKRWMWPGGLRMHLEEILVFFWHFFLVLGISNSHKQSIFWDVFICLSVRGVFYGVSSFFISPVCLMWRSTGKTGGFGSKAKSCGDAANHSLQLLYSIIRWFCFRCLGYLCALVFWSTPSFFRRSEAPCSEECSALVEPLVYIPSIFYFLELLPQTPGALPSESWNATKSPQPLGSPGSPPRKPID